MSQNHAASPLRHPIPHRVMSKMRIYNASEGCLIFQAPFTFFLIATVLPACTAIPTLGTEKLAAPMLRSGCFKINPSSLLPNLVSFLAISSTLWHLGMILTASPSSSGMALAHQIHSSGIPARRKHSKNLGLALPSDTGLARISATLLAAGLVRK
jgi:hypothetical protein